MLPKNISKWLEPKVWGAKDPIYCSAVFIGLSSGHEERGGSLIFFCLLGDQKRNEEPKIEIVNLFHYTPIITTRLGKSVCAGTIEPKVCH